MGGRRLNFELLLVLALLQIVCWGERRACTRTLVFRSLKTFSPIFLIVEQCVSLKKKKKKKKETGAVKHVNQEMLI